MRRSNLALALATLALGAVRADDAEGLKPADLVGGYTIESGDKYGVKEPEERIKGTTVRFTEDAIVVVDKDKKELYAQTYTLGATKAGKTAIALRTKIAPVENEVAHGLIEKKGDTIRLIYALPGGERPTEFKTRDKQLMFEMKNERKLRKE